MCCCVDLHCQTTLTVDTCHQVYSLMTATSDSHDIVYSLLTVHVTRCGSIIAMFCHFKIILLLLFVCIYFLFLCLWNEIIISPSNIPNCTNFITSHKTKFH